MSTPSRNLNANGGHLITEVMQKHGANVMYTLSGGHIFPIYDGACAQHPPVDVRHEQTATFAAEAHAKLTRELGVACLTAGPGVTNGVSAITTALLQRLAAARPRRPRAAGTLGRRLAAGARPCPDRRVGHEARRDRPHAESTCPRRCTRDRTPQRRRTAARRSSTSRWTSCSVRSKPRCRTPRRSTRWSSRAAATSRGEGADARSRATRDRAGTDVWLNPPRTRCAISRSRYRIPVIPNGMGRGCLPSDHELVFLARALDGAQAGGRRDRHRHADWTSGSDSDVSARRKTIHIQDSETASAAAQTRRGGLGRLAAA